MSSMKSFKSRISQKRGDSRSKINMSSQSVTQFNLKHVAMNADNALQFRLQKLGQRIIIAPFKLQITNNTGCNIFIHVNSSHDQYFNINPKKYIVQNGTSHDVTIKLIQISNVQLQDYARQTFTVNWGRITEQQIENKMIPNLTQYRVFKCTFINKEMIDELLARKTYQNIPRHQQHDRSISRNKNQLEASNISMSKRQEFVRSGLDASDLHHETGKQSLLRTNIIVAVAVVSFIIGFLSS